MKTLLIVVLAASTSFAQKVNLFRNGAIEQHQINWVGSNGLRIEGNRFIKKADIDSIQIIENGPLNSDLIHHFTLTNNSLDYEPSPVIVTRNNGDQNYQQPITTVNSNSHPGAAIELLGALALTTYFIMSNNYIKEKTNNLNASVKPPSPLIPIFGAGFMSVGFVIDLSSGSKKKK